jgi:hypothetical protein
VPVSGLFSNDFVDDLEKIARLSKDNKELIELIKQGRLGLDKQAFDKETKKSKTRGIKKVRR